MDQEYLKYWSYLVTFRLNSNKNYNVSNDIAFLRFIGKNTLYMIIWYDNQINCMFYESVDLPISLFSKAKTCNLYVLNNLARTCDIIGRYFAPSAGRCYNIRYESVLLALGWKK